MGCGTSKKSSVVPVIESVEDFPANGTTKLPPILKSKVNRRPSETLALQGIDPPLETMEDVKNRRKHIGRPLAFEVPVVEDGESLIRKHPPRRFQRLEDQQPEAVNLTHELLDEKQAEAEHRRIQNEEDPIETMPIGNSTVDL